MEIKVEKMSKKRARSENWLEEDKILLKELVKERASIIENKNTETNTNSKKLASWNDLQNSFNCMCKGIQRSVNQLKHQWGHMKQIAKKQNALDRKALLQTGGGPPPATQTLNSDDICVWLPNEFTIDTNEFDSDQVNQTPYTDILALSGTTNESTINSNEPPTNMQYTRHVQSGAPNNTTMNRDEPPPTVSVEELKEDIAPSQECTPMPAIKRKKKDLKLSPAERIAMNEIECRKELHKAQMINEKKKADILNAEENTEKKKADILDAKEKLIKIKLEYY